MKNPNGYGTVAKLSGNRRNPYVVRKTKCWDDRGYPVYETIGYFPTREDGLIALAEFNKNPYDINASKITTKELYERWAERKLCKLGKSTQSSLKSAFKHCAAIQGLRYKEIRSFHMQDCIDNCGCGYSTQWAIKNLFGHLDKFAMELDVIQKMYSPLITAEPVPETNKQPFTDDEVNALWAIANQDWVDSVLVLLYGGWRIGELLTIETANVNLSEGTIKGGIKTRAGKDRIVPIHSKIKEIVQRRVEQNNKYLFSIDGKKCGNSTYYGLWEKIMKQIGCSHTPHECRHTFRSRLDSAGANKVCIDLMMGHKSLEVGERVYTHKTIRELKSAIELITR